MPNLIARFDAVLKEYWEPHPIPTPESIIEIERCLEIHLPPDLLEFSRRSKSFSSFFLGVGPDYDSHSHIITRNNYWRRPEGNVSLPAHLVMFTDGFMDDDFWCFDKGALSGHDYAIQYWAPDVDQADVPMPYPNFRAFMTSTIEWYEGTNDAIHSTKA